MRITYLICGLLYASFVWPRPDFPTLLTDGLVATEVCYSYIEPPIVSERLTEPEMDLLPLDDFQRAATKAGVCATVGQAAEPLHISKQSAEHGSALWVRETDPFRRCAQKAIAGEFGELADWQHNAYTWGLAQGVTCEETACLTAYYPGEGFWHGKGMRSGLGVNERYAAVCSRDWRELKGSYVWVMPAKNVAGKMFGGLRQIMDTGANSNRENFAYKYGADRWVDFWTHLPTELVKRTPYCIIETD